MKITYQYQFYPDTSQKSTLNQWLRICRYWYNRQLGDRFDWWERNRTTVNACPLLASISAPRERPNYYSQKKQLPALKKDLVKVFHSGELLDFKQVDSTILQDVSKRVDKAFERFAVGDSKGGRSGKPRFKTEADYRTMTFSTANNDWIKLVRKNWIYIRLPKLGVVKVRMHRSIPNGFAIKQVSVTKKADGWFIQIMLEDSCVPNFTPDKVTPNWDNSIGLDAVLHEDVYLATSSGEKLPSLKPLRKNQAKLDQISRKRNKRKRGSKARRKLAKKEARQHQKIARSRQDFHYKTAHRLVRSGAKFFFHEDLNLKSLTKRNKVKQDNEGTYLPNGQSAKSGLNKSWLDAAFGQFFKTLEYIAEKAGSAVVPQKPAYTSMVLCYRNEIVFTNCGMRNYWDEQHSLMVDRDVNAAINLKKLGLDIFPRIKSRGGNLSVVGTIDNSTAKEILHTLHRAAKKPTQMVTACVGVGGCHLLTTNFDSMNEQASDLIKQGISQYQARQFEAALESWQEALGLYRSMDDKRRSGAALGNMGAAYEALGNYPSAIDCYQQHLVLAREIGDRRGEANALGNLGNACCTLEDFSSAIDYQQQRLAIARESGDARQTLETLGYLALAYDANGDLPGAIECYHEQLSIARASLDDRVERNALKNLKLGYKYLADYEKADKYRQQQLAIVRELFLTDKINNFLQLAQTVGLDPVEDFAGANLSGCDLHYADFNGADLRETNLRGADLTLADLSGALLSAAILIDANLCNANLRDAELSSANLSGADLRTKLPRANLSRANLTGANLSSAYLPDAILVDANLTDANLTNADLSGVDLSGAILNGADLSRADLKNAVVDNAKFFGCLGISEAVKIELRTRGGIFE